MGRLPLFLCFASFLVTFVVTRVITRLIRAGKGPFKDNVSSGGLHVHHAVPGIILLVTGAFMAVAADNESGWSIAAALLVGVGTSLVLDEFALILHLSDVYWADEGRISVEMVSLAVGCLGLLVLGVTPADAFEDADGSVTLAGTLTAFLPHLLFIVVCVAKGKYRFALFAAFIPFLGTIGALRLARATERAARYDVRFGPMTGWISDFIAGKPTAPGPGTSAAPTPRQS